MNHPASISENDVPPFPYRDTCRLTIQIAKRCAKQHHQYELVDIVISDVHGSHPKAIVVQIIDSMIGANFLKQHQNPGGPKYIAPSDVCSDVAQFSDHHLAAWDLIDFAWRLSPKKNGIIITRDLPDIVNTDPTLISAGMEHLVASGLVKHPHRSRSLFPYDRLDLQPISRSALDSPKLLLSQAPTSMTTNNFIGDYQSNNVASNNSGNVNQTASVYSGLQGGDLPSLIDAMRKIGLPNEDIEALKEAVESDPVQAVSGNLGSKVGAWVGDMTQKALTGVWKTTLQDAHIKVVDLIRKFYGLP